jgi:hypothetical protein
MDYTLPSQRKCQTSIGSVTVYVDSYEISAERKFRFQTMASSGIKLCELGRNPALLKLKGRVKRSDGVNPAVKFNEDVTNPIYYFVTIDDVYFNAIRLKTFKTICNTDSEFIHCEFEFYCNSFISQAEGGS